MKNNKLSSFALWVFLAASLFAGEFSLKVTKDLLTVVSATGERVAQVSQGSVGKQINVGGTEFLLSFGKDARNRLSAILSPVLDKNSPLVFSTLNKKIKSDGNAIISINYSSSLTTAEVDGGYIGRVEVADIKGYSSATLTPASLVSDVKPISTSEKERPTVTTQESPKVLPKTAAKNAPKPEKATASQATKETVKSADSEKNKVNAAPVVLAQAPGNSLKKSEEEKDVFSVLKEEGVKGLFESKNMVAGLERSKKSKLVSSSQIDMKKATAIGTPKVIEPEMLSKSANDKTGDIRLVDVKGAVLVDEKSALEGEMVSQKSVIKTDASGSAVAIVGGLHLVTIHPNSSIAIAQDLKEKKMTTLVDLKSGTIFADVNHRKGMTQDFKIKTAKGAVSATGSKALVGTTSDGAIITIIFESTWTGVDANGGTSFTTNPLNAPADAGIKIVSFSSVPAMPGLELQNIVNQLIPSIQNSLVQTSSGNFSFIGDPVFSYLAGNSPTLPDGSTNPGSTIEGKLRNLILAITDVVDTEDKDAGADLLVGGTDPTQLPGSNDFNNAGGRNGSFRPGDTSPGGQ